MDDVFNNAFEGEGKQQTEPVQAEPVAATLPPETQTGEAATEQSEAAGATPAQGTEKHVPLAALEAERAGRKDWKEKALRFEGEMKALREEMDRLRQGTQGQPQQQEQVSPQEQIARQVFNQRFDMSEMLLRQAKPGENIDEFVDVFKAAVKQNPALYEHMAQQRHPWEYAYNEGKRMKLLQEMGQDPDAYRKKMRDEIMAEIQQQPAQQSEQQQRAALPQSLANARSAASRGSSAYTGPTPLNAMFEN